MVDKPRVVPSPSAGTVTLYGLPSFEQIGLNYKLEQSRSAVRVFADPELPARLEQARADLADEELKLAAAMLALPRAKRKKQQTQKRPWTQTELDARIHDEITAYSQVIASARNGCKGAKKTVRKKLGRNALAERLGVKSAKMVSNSPVWQELANEFGMRRTDKAAAARPTKIGLDIAEEVAAKAAGDTTVANVVRRETLALLDMATAEAANMERGEEIRKALASTKERLRRGEIDDTSAREIAEYTRTQLQDDRSDRVLKSL